MKHLKCYLLLLALPCLALQCDPDTKDDEQKPTYYMSEEFKDYVLFPEGSWWVYKNQYGQLDTVKIIWQEIEVENSNHFASKIQTFQHHLYSSFVNDTFYGGGGARLKGGDPMGYNQGSKYSFSYLFFTAKDTGELYYHETKECKYVRKLIKYKINNSKFNHVKVFKTFEKKYYQQPNRIYWAKDVGPIKKVLFDSTVWKLKNYHINN